MELYKVLLVDDESEVIDVILHKINWEPLGFRVIGSAGNGVKALEMVEKEQPDVVFTDIKMPYMDGLELSRQLKKDYPMIRTLLFTGFDEFEYAREALHLEIREYLLKPLNASELTEALKRLRTSLDQEREDKLNVQKLQDYYMESLPMLQVNFFVSLLEGRIREKDLSRYLVDYRIDLSGPMLCSVVFHTSSHRVPEGMSPLLLNMSVQQQIKERVMEHYSGHCFVYQGNTVLILQLPAGEQITALTDECDRFCRWADRIIGATVTAGIGQSVDDIVNLGASYEGAREAVSYRVLYGTGRAINIAEVIPQENLKMPEVEEDGWHELLKVIRMGREEDLAEAVKKEVTLLHRHAHTVDQYRLSAMELVKGFHRYCSNNGLVFEEYKGALSDPYREVPEMDETELFTWVYTLAGKLRNEVSSARNSSSRNLITKAKAYVENHYQEADLSLDTVCAELGVSNSYFSSVFKKEAGKSFISYLTEYRMEKARARILETTEKNYEIAENVGYPDANYFSYVFKKQFGVSPSKYRTEHMRQ
jgi:two-component system response regulator YesN